MTFNECVDALADEGDELRILARCMGVGVPQRQTLGELAHALKQAAKFESAFPLHRMIARRLLDARARFGVLLVSKMPQGQTDFAQAILEERADAAIYKAWAQLQENLHE